MNQDVTNPEPLEYLTWPLEKLQQEYRKTKLLMLAAQIQLSRLEHKMEVVQAFAELMRELQEDDSGR